MASQRLGLYPNLSHHRVQLGWELSDLATRLGTAGPKLRSLYRLEAGKPIRLSGVHRVFRVVSKELGQQLDAATEIQETTNKTDNKNKQKDLPYSSNTGAGGSSSPENVTR